jgi:hypothetical protein
VKTDTALTLEEPRGRGRVRGSGADGRPARGNGERAGSRHRIPLLLGALLVLSLVLSKASLDREIPSLVARSHAISERTLEQEFGLRVDLVGMSAGGGLIDFRFTVLEPEKAAPLFEPSTTGSSSATQEQEHASTMLPVLFAEDSHTLIRARGSMSHHQPNLAVGKTFFILYPNPGGEVQAGTPMSIVLGSVRVEHVTAKT